MLDDEERRTNEMLFQAALDSWKFQIDSFWTRTSSFAVFELAFAAGLWKLFGERHFFTTAGMSVGGILLTLIWIINNSRLHEYILYYQKRLEHYERLLELSVTDTIFLGFAENRIPKRIGGSYHLYIQCIPALFLAGWGWMLLWCICEARRFLGLG